MEMARAFFIICFILSNYYIYVHIKYLLTRLNEKKILARAKKKLARAIFQLEPKARAAILFEQLELLELKNVFIFKLSLFVYFNI